MGKKPVGVSIEEELLDELEEELDYGDSRSAFIENAIRKQLHARNSAISEVSNDETYGPPNNPTKMDMNDIGTAIETMQRQQPMTQPLRVHTLLVPIGAPGWADYKIHGDSAVDDSDFLVNLMENFENLLNEGEYGGRLKTTSYTGDLARLSDDARYDI